MTLIAFEPGIGVEVKGAAGFGDRVDRLVGGAFGEIGFDFDGDDNIGVGEGDDLLVDPAGVAVDSRGVELDHAVVAAVKRRVRLWWLRAWSETRPRPGSWLGRINYGVELAGVGLELALGDVRLDDEARVVA